MTSWRAWWPTRFQSRPTQTNSRQPSKTWCPRWTCNHNKWTSMRPAWTLQWWEWTQGWTPKWWWPCKQVCSRESRISTRQLDRWCKWAHLQTTHLIIKIPTTTKPHKIKTLTSSLSLIKDQVLIRGWKMEQTWELDSASKRLRRKLQKTLSSQICLQKAQKWRCRISKERKN